ncbi:MAG TPA: DUF882 domain-containing protein [Gammaproteobacteria bacterium]|nr:DUF882 domain-containing protein [Gammaproteobacteria bacterium]
MKSRIAHDREQRAGQPARRHFLRKLLASSALLALPAPVLASVHRTPERSLVLRNLHTGERLKTTFWADGHYLRDELQAVNRVLRDHRTGDVHAMDPRLLDLLYLLQQTVAVEGAFHIISGYRSPATNRKLRDHSKGVAKRSLHMKGKAVDIRLPGCRLAHLRKAALSLRAGGVGYYPKSNFIHVDTGRVRRW